MIINGKNVNYINIKDNDGHLIASVSDKNYICDIDYSVEFNSTEIKDTEVEDD